jgi:uncharacterized damage-inducible protein DinB
MSAMNCLQTLWKYNFWAQTQFDEAMLELNRAEFLQDLGDGCGSLRDKLAHICMADEVWLLRIQGNPAPAFLLSSEIPDKEALLERWMPVRNSYGALLAEIKKDPAQLEKIISYKNSKGVSFETPLGQILLHVANHATYHRGQAASLLRRLTGSPPESDLILYFREGFS